MVQSKPMDAVALSKLKPSEAPNPLAEKTWKSTFVGCLIIGAFLLWFQRVYVGYMEHRATGAALPETSILKVGIPVFIASILIEYLISKALGLKDIYRLNDTLANFSNGLFQSVLDGILFNILGELVGTTFVVAIPYRWIFDNYRLMDIDGLTGYILMWFLRDFGYYWFHLASHRVAFMWAVHGVHHQPNEFNYSVNLSQGALQRMTSSIFYAPLALFFNPSLFIVLFPMEKMFGFFTHTKLLNNMYGLGYFFVTPSLHRVHHAGAPAKYIDKNYGEMLSIWDRLFGTLEEEVEPVVYGHVHPIKTFDPLASQLNIWGDIFAKAKTCDSFIDKVKCFIMPPGWDPKHPNGPEYPLVDSTPYSALKYDSDVNTVLSLYAFFFNFLPTLVGGIVMLHFWKKFGSNYLVLTLCVAYVVYCMMCVGRLFDRHHKTIALEFVRIALLPLFAKMIQLYVSPAAAVLFTHKAMAAYALYALVSMAVMYSQRVFFKKETDAEREARVWIPEAGREFHRQLKAAQKTK